MDRYGEVDIVEGKTKPELFKHTLLSEEEEGPYKITKSKMTDTVRLTVLISGNGSNLQAVIDKLSTEKFPEVSIVRVLSNRKDAYGLERARKANIPTTYHNLVKYKKQHPATPEGVQQAREEYDAELARLVLEDKPDLVYCLGFMHVLSPRFLGPLEEKKIKIINLHPALPGQFNGAVSICLARFLVSVILSFEDLVGWVLLTSMIACY